jgi:thiol:disulfide interchange protein DsbD
MVGKSKGSYFLVLALALAGSLFTASQAQAADYSLDTGSAVDTTWLVPEPEFLPVDEAFRLSAVLQPNGTVLAQWRMADGYYLYRHQFGATLNAQGGNAQLGELQIPEGITKVDEFFGEVEVYYDAVDIDMPLTGSLPDGASLTIEFQGCADAGLCYPPERKLFQVSGQSLLPSGAAGRSAQSQVSQSGTSQLEISANGGVTTSNVGVVPGLSEDRAMADLLEASHFAVALALFFVAGIGLAFTPCVFPMVPILSSIIVGEGQSLTKGRAFTLSLAYVLGMAMTYAVVGLLVGLFGAELNLQATLQSPWVLATFSVVFVLLAGAMFGFYELSMPEGLTQWINQRSADQNGGRHPSVFVMGSLSSLVVSPCISAPLAGALIYLSNTGDAVLGGSALFALGLGMGVPLMIVGGSGGHWLPRAGAWMDTVKGVFGFGLLGVAVWLLERLLPGSLALALWALLLLAAAVYLGALEFVPKASGARFAQVVGLVLGLWGSACLFGASAGAVDPFRPLAGASSGGGSSASGHAELRWQPVKTISDVESLMAASAGPVILDLYADWCISCKVMERSVFPVPQVAEKLSQFTLLRADVTQNDDQDQALLKRFGLFGPPSLVFFGDDGSEIADFRIQGEVDSDILSRHLSAVLAYEG